MKQNHHLCISLAFLTAAFLLAVSGFSVREHALAARIAPEILRFHVRAHSSAPEEQELKLRVKDFLLEQIRKDTEDQVIDRTSLIQYIRNSRSFLEEETEWFVKQCGSDHSVNIHLESCHFPEKSYGDMTFPAGLYDAVNVTIGDGAGENFWCVLYPSLCYLDSTHAVVPDDSKELLRTLIPEEDFRALLKARHHTIKKTGQDPLLPRLKIHFKLAEFLAP